MTPRVRPFIEEDIPRIVEMNSVLFPGSSAMSEEVQRRRFKEVCFHNPWYDKNIPSLVYEDAGKKVIGFVAVVPRLMRMNGRTILAAVSQHLMVDPAARSPVAAIELMRRLMSGTQELTLADMASDLSRKIWERLGGTTSHLYSLHWRRLLRPFSFVRNQMRRHPVGNAFAIGTAPIAGVIDYWANSFFPSVVTSSGQTIVEDMSAETLLMLIPTMYDEYTLLPVYTSQSMEWLFKIESEEDRFGKFHKCIVRESDGNILGWFMYHLKPGGTSEVLQIGCSVKTFGAVFDALSSHAYRGGSVDLSGRIDPTFMKEYALKSCLFIPGRSWVLISSKIPEVVQSFAEGRAFFSRMDGDPWFF